MDSRDPNIENGPRTFQLERDPRDIGQNSQGRQGASRGLAVLKFLLLLVSIAIVSSLAVFLVPDEARQVQTDLISRAVTSIAELNPSLNSSDPQLLTKYIREQFEWDTSPPLISGAKLIGAGVQEITDGFDLPAFIYRDSNGPDILVYMLSYRVLDDQAVDLEIPESVLTSLSEEYQLTVAGAPEGNQAVLWREYSFIFLAVSATEEPLLLARINPKRSP